MSKEVDERVVSMQFDNQHFEKNVSTTMSTLEKFKKALHLDGATKGLNNVDAAAKKVSFNPLVQGVQTVQAKFSALEVMGVTALANLTNSAVNAGKRIVSALTIEPITSGFSEYELKMDSVQTIMASTGESIEKVNKYLDELNEYSDKTIYSFSDMTSNIGKFTNAGVKLDDAVLAMKGISNEAAVSGANANEASRAMYNFAQALSAGYVKLIDWKSIELANMATVEFKNELINTAVELGTVVKVGDQYQSTTTDLNGKVSELFTTTSMFNDSLSSQWMTTDVLVKTLSKYADESTEIGAKATEAATQVKTFTQMMDALKESAQSGWARTWELIFGGFYEARDLWTSVNNVVGGIIDGMSNWRNNILEGALGKNSKWTEFYDKLDKAGVSTDEFKEALRGVAKEGGKDLDELIEKYGSLDKVFTSGELSTTLITKALKKLASTTTESSEEIVKSGEHIVETGDTLWGIAEKYLGDGKRYKELAELNEILNPDLIYPDQIIKYTDAQLKSIGYTEEQIKTLRELAAAAEETGTPLNELIDDLSKPDGRTLLFDSFGNIFNSIKTSLIAIKDAWQDIFPPKSVEERAASLYNLIEGFNHFTKKLEVTDETAGKMRRTFKGVFAVLDIIATLTGGALKFAIKGITTLLGYFDLDILDVTASIGDFLVNVRDWIKENNILIKGIEFLAPFLKDAAAGIHDWAESLKGMSPKEVANAIIDGLASAVKFVGKIIGELRSRIIDETGHIPEDIIAGLVNGLWDGIKFVGQVIFELGQIILDKICDVLGIHSPSVEFFKIGEYIIQGLINGIKSGSSKVWETLKDFGSGIIDFFKNLDVGLIIAAGLGVSMLFIAKNISDALNAIAKPLEGIGAAFEGLGDMFEGIGKHFKAKAMKTQSQAVLNMAIAIAILAGSVWLLAKIPWPDMAKAIIGIGALAGVVLALSAAAKMMNKTGDFGKMALTILGISGSLLILTYALKNITDMPIKEAWSAVGIIGALIGGIAGILASFGALIKGEQAKNMHKAGGMILKISIALLLLVGVIKVASMLEPDEIFKGLIVVNALSLLVAGLIAVSALAGEHASKAGSMLLKISFALLIMVGVVKLAGQLDENEIRRGIAVIGALELLFSSMIAVSLIAGKNAGKAGSMLLKASVALLIMVGVIKLISMLDDGEVVRGLAVVSAIGILFTTLIGVSALAGKNAAKAGSMLLMVSGAMLILAGVMYIIGQIEPENLVKAMGAISGIMILFAALIAVSSMAGDCQKSLMTLVIAVGLIAVALAALSFIDPKKLVVSMAALSMTIGMFALLVVASDKAKDVNVGKLAVMIVALAVVAGITALLSSLKMDNAINNASAVGIMILALSGAMILLSKAGTVKMSTVGTMAVLGLVVGELGVILGLLNKFNLHASISDVVALSVMMGVLTALLIPLSVIGIFSSFAMSGVLALAAIGLVVGELGLILGLLNKYDLNTSMDQVKALSVMMGVLTALLIPLSVIGMIVPFAAMGVLALGAIGLVVLELGVILGLLNKWDFTASMDQVKALSVMLTVMTALLIPLSLVGVMAPAAILGIGVLTTFITAVGGLLVALGGLNMLFDGGLEKLINEGLPLLEKLGYAMGSFVGNIVAGFADGALSSLPSIGSYLSQFMVNATPFIVGCKTIDESVMTGVKSLAGAVLALTATDLIAGLAAFLQQGSSFATLGTELSQFMINAMPFIAGASLINESMMAGVKSLAETVLILTAADILNGLLSFGKDNTALTNFGNQLPALGASIAAFTNVLVQNGFDSSKIELVNAAASAIKSLAQVANEIPNTGGLLGMLVGNNDLSTFAAQFPLVGQGIGLLLQQLEMYGFDGSKKELVESAASAVKTLATVAKEIPNTGGLLGMLVGNNDMSTFAAQFPLVGMGIGLLLQQLEMYGFDSSKTPLVEAAASAVKALATVANEIPNTGGLLSMLVGDNNLGTFASQFPLVGTGLAGLVTNMGTFGEDQLNTVTAAAKAIKLLAETSNIVGDNKNWWEKLTGSNDTLSKFAEQLPKLGTAIKDFATNGGSVSYTYVTNAVKSLNAITAIAKVDLGTAATNIESFGGKLAGFGSNIKSFLEGFKGISQPTIEESMGKITSLVNSVSKVSASDASGLTAFGNAILTFAKDTMRDFVDEFQSNTQVESMTAAATSLMSSFGDGVTKALSSVTTKAKEVASAAATGMESETIYNQFYSVGSYLVDGFSAGISENDYKAAAKAAAMASAAYQAAKEELDINSPSKVFRRLGYSVPEGFAMGIDKLSSMSDKSAVSMADTAINGVKKAMARVAEVVNSDMDSQPTIRPVVDLGGVRASVSDINHLLGTKASIGVMTNINAINSMMNRKSQNGANDEVVSEIIKLRKGLGNVGNTTYNVGGITYDDGSNISDAVKSLVRAARVERRV